MKKPRTAPVQRLVTEWNLNVFPVAAGGKNPIVKWQSSYTTCDEDFDNFRKMYKKCNWGVNCGRSKLIVIDIDIKDGKDGYKTLAALEKKYGKLPETFTVRTPTGGYHLYFWGICSSSTEKLGEGLDVKSVGGFVVAPGSCTAKGAKTVDGDYVIEKDIQIAAIPDWFVDLANVRIQKDPLRNTPVIDLDQENNIASASSYLLNDAPIAIAHQSGNSTAYKVACAVRDHGISEDMNLHLMLSLWNERCQPEWQQSELSGIVANANRYSQEAAGSKSPEADFEPVTELPDLPGTINKAEEQPKIDFAKGLLSSREFAKVKFPRRKLFLDPIVWKASILFLYAKAGIGKTFFVLSMVRAIATGTRFGPWWVVNKAKVMYFDAEMTGNDMQSRENQLGGPVDRLYIYSDAYAATVGLPKANILDKGWRKGMEELLIENGIEVLVLDNLSSLSPAGDENAKSDFDPVNQWLIRLKHKGITVIAIHHAGKSGDQRGTSGKLDNVDLVVKLVRPPGYQTEEGARFEVVFEKARLDMDDLHKIVGLQFQLVKNGSLLEWEFNRPKASKKQRIIQMIDSGTIQADIAKELGVTPGYISRIVKQAKADGILDQNGRFIEDETDDFDDLMN
jgi:hypothetical protein